MFSADPERDFLEHDRKAEEWLDSRPVCSVCGEHIQDDEAVLIGGYICLKCIKENTVFI